MLLAILTLLTALSISAVAIYYSVAGLVAIFAAAAVPIMIMGGVLEIGKLVTAVWLHKYWSQATWWLRSYLSLAVVVLMLITSMGIFGFLSKAHIEQTSASEESVARIEQIETEIARQIGIVGRAENKIRELESSGTGADANIQSQIDKEQERIDKAFDRINPAIAQQNKIIEDARTGDATRTKPYENQLVSIQDEIKRLETTAKEYETQISSLVIDASAIEPIVAQIATINATITKVEGQIASNEREQIKQAQSTIGANPDGAAGPNTRRAANAWIETQKLVINDLNTQISNIRNEATKTVNAERDRLANVVQDIREKQIPALKDRELVMLDKIDEVRQTESPVIQTARDEIQRLRESAESQVAQSQALIERLRSQLAQTNKADEIQTLIDEQLARVKTADIEVDRLTSERYELQAEYRKLEAEVGPVKYIAEFVYGENADANLLEEAVRWVILIIIFVFDPLAVLLLIASQYTFEFNRKRKDDDGERLRLEREEYNRARAQRIIDNPGFNIDVPAPPSEQKEELNDDGDNTGSKSKVEGLDGESTIGAEQLGGTTANGMAMAGEDDSGQVEPTEGEIDVETTTIDTNGNNGDVVPEDDTTDSDATDESVESDEVQTDDPEEQERRRVYEELMEVDSVKEAKQTWKQTNPNENLKTYKELYIKGKIDNLPWLEDVDTIPDTKNRFFYPQEVEQEYVQNAEQTDNSLWKDINKK
jgi:hypothetical protein